MEIPRIFYGTLRQVRAETRKLVTKLKKGTPIEELMSAIELLDSDNYPNSLFWINRPFSMLGEQEHFPLCVISETIFVDKRLSLEEKFKIRENLINYFMQTHWGIIILNSTEEYVWERLGGKFEPDNAAKILEGTCQYWNLFINLGSKFFNGGNEAKTFLDCFPKCYPLLIQCGFDISEFPIYQPMPGASPPLPKLGDVIKICEKYDVINKLKYDTVFREKARDGKLFVLRNNRGL